MGRDTSGLQPAITLLIMTYPNNNTRPAPGLPQTPRPPYRNDALPAPQANVGGNVNPPPSGRSWLDASPAIGGGEPIPFVLGGQSSANSPYRGNVLPMAAGGNAAQPRHLSLIEAQAALR